MNKINIKFKRILDKKTNKNIPPKITHTQNKIKQKNKKMIQTSV